MRVSTGSKWDIILLAQKTMASLPKLDLKGQHKHPILTRIDIGSGLEDTKETPYGHFVNEVEFALFSSSIKNFTSSLNNYTNSLENKSPVAKYIRRLFLPSKKLNLLLQ